MPFARGLGEQDVELVASGGTATFLQKVGIPVTPVEDLTEVPELLGGRVKTLHPASTRRSSPAAMRRRQRRPGRARDRAVRPRLRQPLSVRRGHLAPAVGEQDAVEQIDIGGPAMLRAAAKNFAHVAPVPSPERYDEVLRVRGAATCCWRRAGASRARPLP